MTRPVKIGFLSPYSSIYPELNHELIEGFVTAFDESYKDKKVFEFIPEYVNQGGKNTVTEAVKKLLHFYNVDIISGLISYQVIPEIIPMIESRNKLGFFFDLGEYIPSREIISDNIFLNSYQLWQSEFALGLWAQKTFGNKGAVIMPVYEAGYHLHSSFRQGTITSGATELDYHILPHNTGVRTVSDKLESFFIKFKENPPSYLHALFSGNEAIEFMSYFYHSGLRDRIPLLVSSHMASDEILDFVKHLDWKIYSASVWNGTETTESNEKFFQKYNSWTGKRTNLYSLLGYETGLVFRELLPYFTTNNISAIKNILKNNSITTPRGEVNFYPASGFIPPNIDIYKIIMSANSTQKIILEQGKGLYFNDDVFNEIHNENKSGWQNPYLCV